ncbi:MAG: DUF4276 family protein [Chloroflexaceae bacterium]|nr:DUF4276 family protein [Chloroflexaceae bacterium]
MAERVHPGMRLVQQAGINHHLIPLIPVQTTEAWLLADPEALRQVIGTNLTADELCLPVRSHQVESDPNPKQTLAQVVQRATAPRGRRRTLRVSDIFAPMAYTISLERLRGVPAYQRFVDEVAGALIALHVIE